MCNLEKFRAIAIVTHGTPCFSTEFAIHSVRIRNSQCWIRSELFFLGEAYMLYCNVISNKYACRFLHNKIVRRKTNVLAGLQCTNCTYLNFVNEPNKLTTNA